MCAKLGVHQTFSQPHRPRANGRAERAGQQLLSALKKLHVEHGLNWVETLPRALRIYHDMVGESGCSPYFIAFGRHRAVQGIPYTPDRSCEDAVQFFARMEALDMAVAAQLSRLHSTSAALSNAAKRDREPFEVGSLVWVLKPDTLSSTAKIEPRWRGPLKVLERCGERSYVVGDSKGGKLAVHVDQLKIYHPLGEQDELVGLGGGATEVEKVKGHRLDSQGCPEFLVWWKGEPESEATWVPQHHLLMLGLAGHVKSHLTGLFSHFQS